MPDPEWPLPLDAPSDEPPLDLGEHLDADGVDPPLMEGRAQPVLDLGPPIDADEPLVHALEAPSTAPPREIGGPLDADDPQMTPWTQRGTVGRGGAVAPERPDHWGLAQSPPTVEIGEELDAGAPKQRGGRRPIMMAPGQ